jgi:hypothetical protein
VWRGVSSSPPINRRACRLLHRPVSGIGQPIQIVWCRGCGHRVGPGLDRDHPNAAGGASKEGAQPEPCLPGGGEPAPGLLREGKDARWRNSRINQLLVNHKPLWAKAAECAAPGWMRRIEPHKNPAGHGHNANDLTTGLRLITNANAGSEKEHIERRVAALI